MSQAGKFIAGGSSGPFIATITGNSGGAVPPDGAGNFNLLGSGSVVTTGNPGTNTITISLNGTQTLAYTQVNSAMSPYTVLATDCFISVDSSAGAVTIDMPNTTTTGRVIIVKDRLGSAATHNITVTTPGGVVTIDGSTTFVMNTNFESSEFLFNGTSYEVF